MKRIPSIILFVLAIGLFSCQKEPIGLVHLRIEASKVPGGEPAPGVQFFLASMIDDGDHHYGQPYSILDQVTLTTDSNGIIDTTIYPSRALFYSLWPYTSSINFHGASLDKAGSYIYYAGYN